MSAAFGAALAGLFGLLIGSFLNVVIYRLPRGESLVTPRSRCPKCGVEVRPYDNLPVISWLLLRGRCRHCGEPISPRYPLVEALTGLLMAAVVLVKGPDEDALLGLVFVPVLVAVTFIDIDHRIIPNKIMAFAAVAALVILALTEPGDIVEHLIAAAAAGGFLAVAAFAYPAGMGFGDVKLAAVMGLFLGRAVGPAMFAGLIAGTLVGLLIIARKGAKEGRKTAIPFGPYLAFGALVGLFAGGELVDWYLDSFT